MKAWFKVVQVFAIIIKLNLNLKDFHFAICAFISAFFKKILMISKPLRFHLEKLIGCIKIL